MEEIVIDFRLFTELLGLAALLAAVGLLVATWRQVARTREARQRQDVFFQTIPDPVLISRLSDGRILEVNDGFLRLGGLTRNEVVGSTSLELGVWCDPADRDRFLEVVRREGGCQDFTAELLTRTGSRLSGVITAKAFTWGSDRLVLATVRDQSARDRAEAALRDSERRYRLLADHANDVIWTMSLQGRFTYVSPSVLSLRGYTPEEVLGQSLEQAVCPTSLAVVEEGFRRTFEEIRSGERGIPQNFDIEQPCRDGTTVWTEASARVMYDDDHNAVGIVGVTRDITERRRLEQELYARATTDSLTGALNRRRFLELAQTEFKRTKRRAGAMTLALVDIDRLKQINDSLGHSAGDKALLAVTQVCQRNVRDIDVFARFGGDEFVLLFPETNSEQAKLVIERIQHELGGDSAPLTISAGVACLTEDMNGLDRLLERADHMLYRAKESGRNRVEVEPT